MKIRLNKYLSSLGIESRRKCDEFIEKGFVQINGKTVTQLGTIIDDKKDNVVFNKKEIGKIKDNYRTIMLYKPRGYVCSTSEAEGKNVYSLLKNVTERVVSIGRLDKNSEGLLLFSNDGDLVYRLTHPSFDIKKIYNVTVSGNLSSLALRELNKPMKIDGYTIQPAKVIILRPSQKEGRLVLEFTLHEGRNRQIRKMCEQVGLNVHRLVRIQVKKLKIKGLHPGDYRDLTKNEIEALKK